MRYRSLATHAVVLATGVAAGVGGVAVASSDEPEARTASDAQIVHELRTTEKKLDLVNRNLSGYATIPASPSIQSVLKDICRNTSSSRMSDNTSRSFPL